MGAGMKENRTIKQRVEELINLVSAGERDRNRILDFQASRILEFCKRLDLMFQNKKLTRGTCE